MNGNHNTTNILFTMFHKLFKKISEFITGVKVECFSCGMEFKVQQEDYSENNEYYCSRNCILYSV